MHRFQKKNRNILERCTATRTTTTTCCNDVLFVETHRISLHMNTSTVDPSGSVPTDIVSGTQQKAAAQHATTPEDMDFRSITPVYSTTSQPCSTTSQQQVSIIATSLRPATRTTLSVSTERMVPKHKPLGNQLNDILLFFCSHRLTAIKQQ